MLLTVSLDFRDPELAAQIVNAQTSQAVGLSKSLATTDLSETRGYLQQQVTRRRGRARHADRNGYVS